MDKCSPGEPNPAVSGDIGPPRAGAAVSTDSPDHPEYAPVLVGSVVALVAYLLFVELPLQATRQWQRNRTVRGVWLSAANIDLNVWCPPFWVVLPFYIYALASRLHRKIRRVPRLLPQVSL